jgi:hypothetical protein
MRLEIIMHASVIFAKSGNQVIHLQPSVPMAEIIVTIDRKAHTESMHLSHRIDDQRV